MFEKSRFCWCYVPPPYIISIYLERKKFCQCKSATKWGSGFLCESLSFLQETFNFETENSSKSIVQPPSPRLVVGPMHLQISFIVLFVPLPVQNQRKIPPKRTLFIFRQNRDWAALSHFLQSTDFHGFANFREKTSFKSQTERIALFYSDFLQLSQFNLWIEKWS